MVCGRRSSLFILLLLATAIVGNAGQGHSSLDFFLHRVLRCTDTEPGFKGAAQALGGRTNLRPAHTPRRLDYGQRIDASEATTYVAMGSLLLRKLIQSQIDSERPCDTSKLKGWHHDASQQRAFIALCRSPSMT